jgi:hypothetical protein
MINKWYDDGEENAMIRRVLWEDIVSSIHVYEDNVYGWTHSQPSGNPATVIINSLYNSISMRIVWNIIMENTDLYGCRMFTRHVNMISFGDDNVLNISDLAVELFNQNSIADAYAIIGMTYTDEVKGVDPAPFRSLAEVQFLKRSFSMDPLTHQYIAPLVMDTIMEMCNWVRGDVNMEESTLINVEVALMELSLHSRDIFDKRTNQILRACRNKLGQQPQFSSYMDYRTSSYDKNY